MSTGDDFARMIAERKGISVEEHLRRMEEERKERETIREEEGLEEEDEG
jgi:trehalose-6-phosphatase